MAAICFSSFTVLVVIVVCTVKWFDIRITRKEPVRLEIAFSPEQLVMAVQRATQYAIWIGFISLAIEILGAITRCLLEHCDRRSKVWQFFQCVAFSLVALWMFAVSLYSFSAVDRVVQRSLPKVVVDWYRATEYLELTNAYGLFRSMTGVGGRPEVIIIGSNSLKGPWEEYNFLYKPGNIYQPPPFVAPHQPRLDWQMWFAALESYSENPWFLSLVHKLLLGKKDVMQLLGRGPFDESPPQFIRAQLYLYHYTQNTSSLSDLLLHQDRGEKAWWTREFVRDYLPFTASNSSLSDLEKILEKSGVYRPSFKVEVTWGILHPLIRDLRRVHRQMAPTTLINAILFMVVTCLVLKVWWRRTGRKFCTPSLIRVRDKTENLLKTSSKKLNPNMEKTVNKPSSACAGNCACCVKCADKFCEAYKHLSKKLTICWEMTQSKFTERINRCKAVWKNRMPSVKKKA